jgi:hypothetical protein
VGALAACGGGAVTVVQAESSMATSTTRLNNRKCLFMVVPLSESEWDSEIDRVADFSGASFT